MFELKKCPKIDLGQMMILSKTQNSHLQQYKLTYRRKVRQKCRKNHAKEKNDET